MVKYTWFLKVGLEETFIYCFTHSFTDDIIKALYVAPTHIKADLKEDKFMSVY